MYSESDEENEEIAENKYLGKDGIILMVDATKPMFAENSSGESPFRMCLKACEVAMQHKIFYCNMDIISVVFFGTELTSNDSNLSHITVLQKLDRPSAPSVKQLRNMHESKTYDGFSDKYGHNDDYLFADVLWLAHSMFCKSLVRVSTLRIFLLTCAESPGKTDPHSMRQAITRAKDLRGSSITVDVLPCSTEFQPSDFLKSVMGVVEGNGGMWSLPKSHLIYSLEDIPKVVEKIVSSKDQRSRCLGTIPFKIGEDVTIDVEVYNLVRKASYPRKTLLSRITNEVLTSNVNRYKHTITAGEPTTNAISSLEPAEEEVKLVQKKELVMNFDLAKYQECGGERIKFTQDELKQMKRILNTGLLLLGFVPIYLIKETHHCSPASFIYPSKNSNTEAKNLFSALWLCMGRKNVAAVCTYKLREAVTPRLVALLPAGVNQESLLKTYQKRNIHTIPEPQGFHLFHIPFSDDLNSLGLPERPAAYPRQADLAVGVLRKLRSVFHPSLYPNPVLETFWNGIEALALECEEPRQVIDETRPNYDEIDERLGNLADAFVSSVYPEDYDPDKKLSKASVKRTCSEFDMDVVEAARRNKKLGTLTVEQLKAYLRAKGKPISGRKKVELMDDIYALD